jgi:hypothetical protein
MAFPGWWCAAAWGEHLAEHEEKLQIIEVAKDAAGGKFR